MLLIEAQSALRRNHLKNKNNNQSSIWSASWTLLLPQRVHANCADWLLNQLDRSLTVHKAALSKEFACPSNESSYLRRESSCLQIFKETQDYLRASSLQLSPSNNENTTNLWNRNPTIIISSPDKSTAPYSTVKADQFDYNCTASHVSHHC